jgi:hypothetical protein
VQKSTFNGIQQPNTTEGDSARRSPARPCSSSVQDCTENMLLDSQLNRNSGGPHKVGQGEKELSIVNNLKNFTENLGDKCGVDSLENSDDTSALMRKLQVGMEVRKKRWLTGQEKQSNGWRRMIWRGPRVRRRMGERKICRKTQWRRAWSCAIQI